MPATSTSDPPSSLCPRCGTAVARLIDGLCPACLARNVSTGLEALLAPPAPPDELAPEIEGIEILEPLGAGGMGLVFRGVREADGGPVAVKVLPRGPSSDPEWRERFQREAAALSALDHPGIVKILGSGETLDGRLYLAMELVEGCDLRRLLKTGKLAPGRALDIATSVAAALAHAHERGIIHRDIKPGNILVGEGSVVKVADFGIARAISGDASSFTLTQTREAFGTPYYIAPEVVENATAASPASDVYAVGVLLYEMLTGRVPMGKFTPVSRGTGLDSQVDDLIASALDDDPAARTQGMPALLDSLHTSRRRLEQRGARRRWRLGLGIAAGLAVSAGAGVWITSLTLRRDDGPHFPPPSTATTREPWTNTLGMKFVPVPKAGVLFSIWETRKQDFRACSSANILLTDEGVAATPLKMATIRNGQEVFDSSTWEDPGFAQGEDHPVVGVSMVNANYFCLWLTMKEHAEGRLPAAWHYRLPGTAEWDAAFAAGPDVPANIAGMETEADGWPPELPRVSTSDPFPRTAPVGSFPPNSLGIFDLNGNIREGCLDISAAGPNQHKLNFRVSITGRGASWRRTELPDQKLNPGRQQLRPFMRRSDTGFRLVLTNQTKDSEIQASALPPLTDPAEAAASSPP